VIVNCWVLAVFLPFIAKIVIKHMLKNKEEFEKKLAYYHFISPFLPLFK